MAEEEGEDLFASLIKFCKPTSSQESKLQNCSFARESETFQDYFDSLATSSPEPSPLKPVGIVIVSPPDTDSEKNSSIDRSNTQENEDFLTPPEHHNPSASSSQEDLHRLKPVSPGDTKVSVSFVAETTAGDNGRVENEVSVGLGGGEKNLGFSGTQEIESRHEFSEGQCLGGINEVWGIERFECELKRFRGFDSKLNTPISKKIRVAEGNCDSDMQTQQIDETRINDNKNDTEIIDLDTEEIDEGLQGKIIIDLDAQLNDSAENGEVREHGKPYENVQEVSDTSGGSVDKIEKTEKCGSNGERDKEKGVDLDGDDEHLKVNGDLTPEESEEGFRDNNDNEVQRDGKAVSGRSIKRIRWRFRCGGHANGLDNSGETVARCRQELPSSIINNNMGEREGIGDKEKVQKSKNSGSDQKEKGKSVASNGGGKGLKVIGTLTQEESENGFRDIDNGVQGFGKTVLGGSSIRNHGKFRCGGHGNGVDSSVKERIPRGKHELPSSIEDTVMREEESIGNREEVQMFKNSGSDIDIGMKEKEKGAAHSGGGKCPKERRTLAIAQSEKRIRDNSNSKMHRDGKAVLGSSSTEKIEKFRYESPDKRVDHSAKGTNSRGCRELPPSIRGKEKDIGGGESSEYIKVKSGSWKDLVDALEVVLGNTGDGCEDVDFLETAKRRGLSFPQPRWT